MKCPKCEGRCGRERVIEGPKDGHGQPITYVWEGCEACDQTGHIGAPARRVAMIVPEEPR